MKYHFIGVNGVGMSALAKVLSKQGHCVTGSDYSPTLNKEAFKAHGITVYKQHNKKHISNDQTVVVSSAINESNIEYRTAIENKCEIIKRGDLLAKLASECKKCIAIAGTHGKTTTASLILNIFDEAKLKPSYFIGGFFNNKENIRYENKDIFITEVDESDGSFLSINPNQAVISNIEQDHLDYYKDKSHINDSFTAFIQNTLNQKGQFAINLDDPNSNKIIKGIDSEHIISYSIDAKDAKIRATNIEYTWSGVSFSLMVNDTFTETVSMSIFGKHNVYNALAAISISMMNEIPLKHIIDGLSSFKGVGRRLELKYKANDIVLYDDYAHHPTEIITTLEGVYKSFNKNRIITVFQPHRYSRLTNFFESFSIAFSRSNKTLVVPVFGGGEQQGDYKSSQDLVDEINKDAPVATACQSFDEVVSILSDTLQANDIIILMGAGDISLLSKEIIPIIQGR